MLQRREANLLLEIIDRSIRCGTEEDFRQLVPSLQDLIPFEFALCVLSGSNCSSAEPYHMVNVSYPSAWLDLYLSERLDKVDPVLMEHRLHFGVQYWSDSYEKHTGHEQFVTLAEDHGLKTGYSYGLKTESGKMASLFSFGGRSMKRVLRTCGILRRIVPHLHQVLVRIMREKSHRATPDPGLSAREKEVLKWVMAGKSSWDIARILKISQRTVKFHVENIMQKVHAVTRAQAVAISVEEGLIDIE